VAVAFVNGSEEIDYVWPEVLVLVDDLVGDFFQLGVGQGVSEIAQLKGFKITLGNAGATGVEFVFARGTAVVSVA
jgi:hypothetical protein